MASIDDSKRHGNKSNLLTGIVNKVRALIRDIFSLEEVEVTFTKVGDSTRYTYTKISHRQVARG